MKQDFLTVNGYRIRYMEGGSSSKHIIFLHGLGASAERWQRVLPAFAERFHVVAPDIIGFGYSDKPEVSYTIPFFMQFVKGLADAMDIKNMTLIGASLGGHIAAEMAVTRKEMVDKLVLVTPAGIMKEPTPVLNYYIAAAMYPTFDNAKKAFEQMAGNPKAVDVTYARDFVNRMQLPNAKYAYMSSIIGSKSAPNLVDRLKNIKSPTMIVWGEKDRLIPLKYAGRFKREIRNSRLEIIKGSGHTPYFEKPEIFSKKVIEFLMNYEK
jgi:pimeloyl-ACP methyl ester carboxylesterase